MISEAVNQEPISEREEFLNGQSITLILGLFFLILGIFKIQSALAWRERLGWGWILFSALLSILLGIIIIMGLPGTALWAIGLILGIDLIFSGVALIAVGSRLTSLCDRSPE